MATGTGGTTANNSLTSLQFNGGSNADADVATIANAILDDQLGTNNGVPARIWPGAFVKNGLLFIPNRTLGGIRMLPGDRVMVDTVSGWPILVSKEALAIAGSVWNSSV